jgi:hypothetical protein
MEILYLTLISSVRAFLDKGAGHVSVRSYLVIDYQKRGRSICSSVSDRRNFTTNTSGSRFVPSVSLHNHRHGAAEAAGNW